MANQSTSPADAGKCIAVIGLGIMGSAIARNLIRAGWTVKGYDPDPHRREEAQRASIILTKSAAAAALDVPLALTSLPSAQALEQTVEVLLSEPRLKDSGLVVAEMSTLSLECKLRSRDRLAQAGITLLDCPISGTGAQAEARDIVIYASGERGACERCLTAFEDFSRSSIHLGEFGNGMRMKLVANLLVAIHNVAAAEAIGLALRAGLDPASVCEVLGSGAAASRMLQLRGPMMIEGRYEPPTMKLDVWQKDLALISEFARATGAATPLFSATVPLYEKAVRSGLGRLDTAAVYTVLNASAPDSQP